MLTNPEILNGCPGAGKTTALLDIVDDEMVAGTAPDRIGFVTFTRRGAETAISRAMKRFKCSKKDFVFFRTLHSLAYAALGLRPGDVMERNRLEAFADYAGVRVTGRWADDGSFAGYETGDRVLFMENLARMRGLPLRQVYDEDDDRLQWGTVDHVARCYAAFKGAHGLVDYTDMLLRFIRDNQPPRLDVLLVDEAQDLSLLQWRVVDLLARHARRVVVAGDDDQAIYRWAGADVETLITMQGRQRVLGLSHRCPAAIQAVGAALIARVRHRRPKQWSPRPGEGVVERVADFLDVEELDLSALPAAPDVAPVLVLARNQYVLAEQVEPELRRRGIVYAQGNRTSLREESLRAIAAWEALRAGGSATVADAAAVYRLIPTGAGGVARGAKARLERLDPGAELTMAWLRDEFGLERDAVWHDALEKLPPDEVSYMLAARRSGQKLLGQAQVRLSTIHGAKGGEARHVILMTEMARRTFVEMRDHEEDEHRVFYVGVTRARERLTIVGSQTDRYYPHV